jgi:hypothetical protein
MSICSIDGCELAHYGRGWCASHYKRWLRKGDPGSSDFAYPREDAHPRWAGDRITYSGMHKRVAAYRGTARQFPCVDCGNSAKTWAYDHIDPNELADDKGRAYSSDVNHYDPKCHSCHKIGDLAVAKTRKALAS